MRLTKQLFIFILLNIVVSFATTYGVLWWWERNHKVDLPVIACTTSESPNMLLGSMTTTLVSPSTALPLPPLDQSIIEIKYVIGAGDVQTEYVQLNRLGEGDLWLTGWQLQDDDGNVFMFPNLKLNKGGAVQIFTRAGTNTVIVLYWGQQKSVWHSGEMATLIDSQGNIRSNYLIP